MKFSLPTLICLTLSLVAVVSVIVLCVISLLDVSHYTYIREFYGFFDKGQRSFFISNGSFIPNHFNETDSEKPPSIPLRFLVKEEDFCKKRPDLDYIAYVHSALSHVQARIDTRMTWANSYTAARLGVKIGVVFVVGRARNIEEERILKSESDMYHDIVQGDFADDYKLLTYKGLASLEWITRHCENVPWTIHVDDDVVIDIFLLNEALRERGVDAKDEFLCYIWTHSKVKTEGKWAVDKKDMPETYYPAYCQGSFWVLQTRNLRPLLNASQYVNFYWMDDVYVTGFLPREVGTIGHSWFPKYSVGGSVGSTIFWIINRRTHRKLWEKVLAFYQKQLK